MYRTCHQYEASWPVREGDHGAKRLYLRHDVGTSKRSGCWDVALNLSEKSGQHRDRVAYLSAPSIWGKPPAILPVICQSVELRSDKKRKELPSTCACLFANNNGDRNSPQERLVCFGARISVKGFLCPDVSLVVAWPGFCARKE